MIKPKIIKIPKDFVICDGMTEEMGIPMELFYTWGVLFGIWAFYKLGIIITSYKENKKVKK